MELFNTFAYGVLTALSFVAGLFFVRYWRETKDRFFLFLVITFWVLAGDWASLTGNTDREHVAYFYLPKLFAFLVLLVGIADKNRRAAKEPE